MELDRKWWLLLLAVILLGVGLRSTNFTEPEILDFHAWRQADTAAFTNGYLTETLNPFDPSIDRYPCTHKDEPFGRVEAEFPVVAWLAAVPLAALQIEHPPAPYLRAVSLLFFALTCLYLFLLVLRLGGEEPEALMGVLAFSVLPLSIFFTRTIQPDGPALFFSVGFLYHLLVWLEDGHLRDGVASAVLCSLVLLIKISNGFLFFPAVYLFISRKGLLGSLKTPKYWVWGVLILVTVALWYWHARQFAWSFGIWGDRGASKFTSMGIFTNPGTWRWLTERVIFDILTWAGVILAVVGLSQFRKRELIRFAAVWAAAVVFFVVMTLPGNKRHIYYQLPIVLPAALLIGPAIYAMWRAKWAGRLALAGLLVVHVLISYHILHAPKKKDWQNGYFQDDVSAKIQEASDLVDRNLDDGERLVSSTRHPAFFYNARHRGWFISYRRPEQMLACADERSPYILLPKSARKGFERANKEQAEKGKRCFEVETTKHWALLECSNSAVVE